MTDSYNNDTDSVKDNFGNTIYVSKSSVSVGQCILWGVIVGIIVAIVMTSLEMGKHKPVKKATHADYYVNDENVKMSVVEDRYLRSHEVKTKVSTSSSSGDRSGGSTHSGSSGRSHGGGSRKF